MALAIALHVLSAVTWVGGMFFAYMAMRPAVVEVIEAGQRGKLWYQTLTRFFRWVWLAIALLLITGYWMIFKVFGGMAGAGWHIHTMQLMGLIMMAIFFHLYFAPFRRLKQAVAASNPQEGGRQVGKIRQLVGINLILGLIVVAIGSAGRFI
ncbi:CopD family protein [Marinobacter salexigens]|uniref:CopD family protein n=1 Tax=Marinobacter salexigens TaxID=1925763 RepID=UPI000C28C9E9|nr:CopD family protein [Marinobacter salexigens]